LIYNLEGAVKTKKISPFLLFSTPYEGEFFSAAEMIVRELPGRFVARLRGMKSVDRLDDELEAALQAMTSAKQPLSYYRPELGTVALSFTRFKDDNPDPELAAGQFMLAAFMSGAIEWLDRKFVASRPLCIAARTLASSVFEVHGAGDRLSIAHDRGVLELRRSEAPGFALWQAAEDVALANAGSDSAVQMGFGEWAALWGAPDIEPRPTEPEQFRYQIQEAFALLESASPAYYLWTAALLRELTAKGRPENSTTTSCSNLYHFGAIEICQPATVLETAEMLVHECSHQYYNIASWFTTFVKDNAPEAYSVLKHKNRPLERLLLGFHAFGNALLMYDELHRSALPFKGLSGRIPYVQGLVDDLYEPVRNHAEWLTDSGRDLFIPLVERLIARGKIPESDRELFAEPARASAAA
jgi:HEXXH motif-containing protein